MITISGKIVNTDTISKDYSSNSIEAKIIKTLSLSDAVYDYSSLGQLKFELEMRSSIIDAAKRLDSSYFRFRTFKKAKCNTDLWNLTDEGGFLLKEGVKPYEAINDIFENGYKYGTECSTAIIIVYYGALLKVYPEELFNSTFKTIQLMNWHYIDDSLDVVRYKNVPDYLPGDCRYFVNPEFDPDESEWQGENVIDLGDNEYYGHGIGIGPADYIIRSLNRHRKPDATQSAYLKDSSIRPNFKFLSNIYLSHISRDIWDAYSQDWEYFKFFF